MYVLICFIFDILFSILGMNAVFVLIVQFHALTPNFTYVYTRFIIFKKHFKKYF